MRVLLAAMRCQNKWSTRRQARDAPLWTANSPHVRTLRPFSISLWELNLQSTGVPVSRGSYLSPLWAGISTLAVAPGCCGFTGPVPSATLDKRCQLQQRKNHIKT